MSGDTRKKQQLTFSGSARSSSRLVGYWEAAHGLIAIEATGGLHPEKGLAGAASGLEFLVQLLSRKP